jgi:GAF domain-containing protein
VTDTADVGFRQHVANQVAVAGENALAFQEIEALKDKLAKENAPQHLLRLAAAASPRLPNLV